MPEVGVHERKVSFSLLARGALAMFFALGAIATHRLTIGQLAVLFAIYALADSGLSFFEAYQLGRADNRKVGWLFAIEGLLSAALAVIAFAAPGTILLRIIGGLRALSIGFSDANWAHRTRASLAVEVSGFASILLGVLLLVWPGPGTLALPWLIGLPSLVSGALMVAGAFGELTSEESAHATA
jgi:uncharacterized membrane protein HdeD (DUF308 family)